MVISLGEVVDHPDDKASGVSNAQGKYLEDKAFGMNGTRGKYPGDEASRMRDASGVPGPAGYWA